MPRKRTATASKPVKIQIATPAPIARRRGRRSVVVRRTAKRAARAVGQAAIASRHTMYAVGSAAVLGYALKSGWKIPTLFNLTPAASAALGAWAFGYFGKNVTAQHIATGLLSAAVYDKAKGTTPKDFIVGDDAMGTGVAFDDVDVEGDDDDED